MSRAIKTPPCRLIPLVSRARRSRTSTSSPTRRSITASRSRVPTRRAAERTRIVTLQQAPPAFTLPAALLSRGFALRPETEADIPFLMRLFASTREEELAPAPWSAEQKQAFLASQFQAQRYHYRTFIKDCSFDVIEENGVPAGRFYLEPRASCL